MSHFVSLQSCRPKWEKLNARFCAVFPSRRAAASSRAPPTPRPCTSSSSTAATRQPVECKEREFKGNMPKAGEAIIGGIIKLGILNLNRTRCLLQWPSDKSEQRPVFCRVCFQPAVFPARFRRLAGLPQHGGLGLSNQLPALAGVGHAAAGKGVRNRAPQPTGHEECLRSRNVSV